MSKTADEERKRIAEEDASRRAEATLRELLQLVQLRRNGATQRQAAEALRMTERNVQRREATARELLSRKCLRRSE